MSGLKSIGNWLQHPDEQNESVVGMFFVIGLGVLFTGFWLYAYRKVFGTNLLG